MDQLPDVSFWSNLAFSLCIIIFLALWFVCSSRVLAANFLAHRGFVDLSKKVSAQANFVTKITKKYCVYCPDC